MKQILINILKILKTPIWIVGFIIGLAIILIPSLYFLDKDLVTQNLWVTFYYTEITLTIIISILFGIFLWGTLYKIQFFSVKKSGVWVVGGILGVLVSGCPACSITIASYIGLAGILSVFPYHGLELKFVSVVFLIYACWSTLKNLETCSIKK